VSQYRLLSAAGQVVENGEAEVSVAGGALVVSSVTPLRVPFGQIESVTEPEPFVVRIGLGDGSAIELSRIGVMRTQLLAELRDGRAASAAAAAGVVGTAETFPAWCSDTAVQVRVYDDAFMVDAARFSFSFVGDVAVKDYAVIVQVAGREPVTLTRLGRQTTELAGLLNQRLGEARVRTASFLGSLLPGLGVMEARSAAAALRDGVAVPARELDLIHPALSGTLLEVATLRTRSAAVAWLAERTEMALGFRQLTSVRRPATGTEAWHDHAATPHIGSHDSPGGAFRPGVTGMLAAGMMSDIGADGFGSGEGLGGFGFGEGLGWFGEYWAFRALGAGMTGRQPRPMASRPDTTRGLLTPATDDPSALTIGGTEPTVLAFALCAIRGRVIYEVLNQPEPDTYVFVADDEGGLSTVNRALDEAGFRPDAGLGRSGAAPLADGPLARSLSDQIPHDEHWHDRISGVISLLRSLDAGYPAAKLRNHGKRA
jgi:hypothetical protein